MRRDETDYGSSHYTKTPPQKPSLAAATLSLLYLQPHQLLVIAASVTATTIVRVANRLARVSATLYRSWFPSKCVLNPHLGKSTHL